MLVDLCNDDRVCVCVCVCVLSAAGRVLAGGGVSMVTSHPESRRKGHIRLLLRDCFRWMHEQKIAVTALYPFKESFYEKFGFVAYPASKVYKFDPRVLAPLLARAPSSRTTDRLTDCCSSIFESTDSLSKYFLCGAKKLTIVQQRRMVGWILKNVCRSARDVDGAVA